ncbi:hypothetical protein AGMMS4957_19480 [Bacteroidia bacterium]|nr:hypothetical protein AGMMS4957_19480 [Bacteroidia bacterium]
MKTTIKGLRQVLLLTLLGGVAGLSSCLLTSSDRTETSYIRKEIAFSLSVPSLGPATATYAMTTTDQLTVKNIQILVFDAGGEYIEKKEIDESAITKQTGNLISFTVESMVTGSNLSLVILANAKDIVGAANLYSGFPKSDLADLLINYNPYEIPAEQGASIGLTQGSTIPMWGEKEVDFDKLKPTIVGSNQYPIPTLELKLYRMLARVNVKMVGTPLQSVYKLKDIYVYNTYDRGSVVPRTDAWETPVSGDQRAIKATIPNDAIKRGTSSSDIGNGIGANARALHYSGSAITTTDKSSDGAIFLFESDNSKFAGPDDFLNQTCLVLGIVNSAADDAKSYYRVDFKDYSADKYLDILRNREYTVTVTNITGFGAPTPDEAFSTKLGNIDATVLPWDETALNNVFTDGPYRLSLSELEYNFDSSAYGLTDLENKLTIFTTYPDGWQVDSIMDMMTSPRINMTAPGTPASQKWLYTDIYAGTSDRGYPNEEKTIRLAVTANSGTPRLATVYISAGSISAQVLVRQSNMQLGRLTITDIYDKDIRELTFNANANSPTDAPAAQQFKVNWKPKDGECLITRIGGSDKFNFGTTSPDSLGLPLFTTSPTRGGRTMTQGTANGTPGTQTFTIKPPALLEAEINAAPEPPFLEKLSQVNFFIYTGLGGFKSESIILRQINYALLTTGLEDSYLPDDPYDSGDEIHVFKVKSNARWRIINVTGAEILGGGDIKIGTSGGRDNQVTETELRFVTTSRKGIVVITFGDDDRTPPLKFADVKAYIRIDQPPAVFVPEEVFLTEKKLLIPDGITIESCEVGRTAIATVSKNAATGEWYVTGQKVTGSTDTTRVTVKGKSSNGVSYTIDVPIHVYLPIEWYVAPAPAGHRNNSGFYENVPLATMDSVLSSIKRIYELHTVINGDSWPLNTPATIIASGVLNHTTSSKNMVDISAYNLVAGVKEPAYPPILIQGSTTGATLTMASTASYASVVSITNGNTVTLGSNLTLSGGKGQSNKNGGAVYADSATVYLDGATITGGTTTNISGVYLANNSLFELRGGTINSNKGTTNGFGVHADSSTVVMKNTADISNNDSHGVYLKRRSVFTMDGGEIRSNGGNGVEADSSTVTLSGSALIANNVKNGVQANSPFTMNGGEITANEQNGVYYTAATGDGYVQNQFLMNGGMIRANTKSGVRVESRQFAQFGGTISGNGGNAGSGGGVYVGKDGMFVMWGGTISGHLSLTYGGGVSLEGPGAVSTLMGGEITGNSATNGGGVYVRGVEGNHFLKQGVPNTNAIFGNTATIGKSVRAGALSNGSRNIDSMSGEKLEAWFTGGLWAYDTTAHYPWDTAP